MRIMIVEDNRVMRMMIRMVIGEDNNQFFEFENGLEAVNIYSTLKPDYVLMDINMEIMDGITATRNIMAQHPKAKIILITDYDTMTFKTEAVNAGALHYILKENLFELQDILKPQIKNVV